jgi:hypothetical protein
MLSFHIPSVSFFAPERKGDRCLAQPSARGSRSNCGLSSPTTTSFWGTLREHYYVDGEFLDATLYGWVADEC